jgi:hypothetical protein
MPLYYLYVICLFTKIITENLRLGGDCISPPPVTKLATYGSNLSHSNNVGKGLLAIGRRGFKRSTDNRGSSVHASPSFVCLSVAKTPTIDDAIGVRPIGEIFFKVLRAVWPFLGGSSSNYTGPPAAMCSVSKQKIIRSLK